MKNRVRDSFAVGVGKRLQIAREAAGYTQAELARALGVDPQRLSHWELGKHHLPGIYAHEILRECRINSDWLYSAIPDKLPGDIYAKCKAGWKLYIATNADLEKIKPNPRLRDVAKTRAKRPKRTRTKKPPKEPKEP